MTWFIIAIVIIILIPIVLLLSKAEKPYSAVTYYDRAKEVGFTITEANRIKNKARELGIVDPGEALWHTRELDMVIAGFTEEFRAQKVDKQRDTIAFM
ncbi:MAG TPA: hypothetical protein PLJ83_07835 [Spirochaetales bacterium]|nr:hypothetical protein [Spirochaetales bacterium]